jgi:hypothetical protein
MVSGGMAEPGAMGTRTEKLSGGLCGAERGFLAVSLRCCLVHAISEPLLVQAYVRFVLKPSVIVREVLASAATPGSWNHRCAIRSYSILFRNKSTSIL